MSNFDYAIFGNRGGSHQLIETSLTQEESLLEELRFLVDRPVGQIGPEISWSPYWGCGPISDWWVLWYGIEDKKAERKNMVTCYVSLIRQKNIDSIENLEDFFPKHSFNTPEKIDSTTGAVIDLLSRGNRPVVVPDISIAPKLLISLWPRLWPSARKNLSLRTCFGCEALDGKTDPFIVIIPKELGPRWRSYAVVDSKNQQPENIVTSFFSGAPEPEFERLLCANLERLPSDFTVLKRLERIASSIKILQKKQGKFADALLVFRTLEAFDWNFALPLGDFKILVDQITKKFNPTITDIRGASLTEFTIVGKALKDVELATSLWLQDNLHKESDEDALWILEHQSCNDHVAWWIRAVRKGLSNAFKEINLDWGNAIWRWWSLNITVVDWIQGLLPDDFNTETSLLKYLPSNLKKELQRRIIKLCSEKQWPRLLAGILPRSEPLIEAVDILREKVSEPELGLDILIRDRDSIEIVTTAISCIWEPLINKAVKWTTSDTNLLTSINIKTRGATVLLAAHIKAGGIIPSEICDDNFLWNLFDGCIDGDESCHDVVIHLGSRAASAAIGYSHQDALWDVLKPDCRDPLLSATATAWLDAFITEDVHSRPDSVLSDKIRENARSALSGGTIGKVINFLNMFMEVSERDVIDWLINEEFSWEVGDDEKFGHLLLEREWKDAARSFRWSRKTELKVVAWYARGLLSIWDVFWFTPPLGVNGQIVKENDLVTRKSDKKVKILFLAANPKNSERLAIDEEAREIKEKISLSRRRDKIEIQTSWAIRPNDLQQELLETEPNIVHFSGHGGGRNGIVLHSGSPNKKSLVSSEALSDLFKVLKDNIRIVVLNACYSEEQAKAIVKEIDFVVGMADSIGDDAARVFAAAFYRGLAFGKSVQKAFDLGLNELKIMNLKDDQDIPVLLVRDSVDASAEIIVPDSSS